MGIVSLVVVGLKTKSYKAQTQMTDLTAHQKKEKKTFY